ncbi:MAG: flagellin FliC [Bdellovibrionaceae bacterium]|nr:flagellin FliC [Pseudobdellovibrionaceae bacterium]
MKIFSQSVLLATQRVMQENQRTMETSMKQLASGNRFAHSGVDSASQAISENIRAQTRGLEAATANAENATSLVQQAEGALNEQNNILIRMRELSVQAASDTFSETEREFLNYEFEQLNSELDRIARTTRFGSQNLLDGSERSYEFQVGSEKGNSSRISYQQDANTTATQLGVEGLSIEDQSSARDSLDSIDEALTQISGARAKLGAVQSRLEHAISNNQSQTENLSSAYSKLADTDVAKSFTEMRRSQILQQYQVAVLANANDSQGYGLKLIA